MSAKKVNEAVIETFIFVSILFVLFLTSINIKNYLTPKKVLGAETKADTETSSVQAKFWSDFLTKNPNYLPGLKETGNIEEIKKIDPNWE
jgi:hypothetical protein